MSVNTQGNRFINFKRLLMVGIYITTCHPVSPKVQLGRRSVYMLGAATNA